MKSLSLITILTVVMTINCYSQDKHSIYFPNLESIEFKVNDHTESLTLTTFIDGILSSFIIIKLKSDSYLFSSFIDGEEQETMIIGESLVRQMMPTFIKHYVDTHQAKIEELNKIINLIY